MTIINRIRLIWTIAVGNVHTIDFWLRGGYVLYINGEQVLDPKTSNHITLVKDKESYHITAFKAKEHKGSLLMDSKEQPND